MSERTKSYYQQKVDWFTGYVRQNPGADLSIATLASRAAISPFHFHRILRAALGESPGSYINRHRLEAAVGLIRQATGNLSDVAIEVGFSDVSAFSKAFTKQFGIAPSEFRQNPAMELNARFDYIAGEKGPEAVALHPKTVVTKNTTVMARRVAGEYGGPAALAGWDELEKYAARHGLLTWRPQFFSVYYDDPDEMPPNQCRSDLCIATKRAAPETDTMRQSVVEGGSFAVFRFRGSFDELPGLYRAIYRDWVLPNNIIPANRPIIEKYIRYSPTTNPADYVTDIYLPVAL